MTSGTSVSYCCWGIRGTKFRNIFHINIKYFIVICVWTWLPSDLFIISSASSIAIAIAISISIAFAIVVPAAWIGVNISWNFILAASESIGPSHHVFKGCFVLMPRGLALTVATGVLGIKAPTMAPTVCSKWEWVVLCGLVTSLKRVVAFTRRNVLDSTCQKWLKTV